MALSQAFVKEVFEVLGLLGEGLACFGERLVKWGVPVGLSGFEALCEFPGLLGKCGGLVSG